MTVWYFWSMLEPAFCSVVSFDLMANNTENDVKMENFSICLVKLKLCIY